MKVKAEVFSCLTMSVRLRRSLTERSNKVAKAHRRRLKLYFFERLWGLKQQHKDTEKIKVISLLTYMRNLKQTAFTQWKTFTNESQQQNILQMQQAISFIKRRVFTALIDTLRHSIEQKKMTTFCALINRIAKRRAYWALQRNSVEVRRSGILYRWVARRENERHQLLQRKLKRWRVVAATIDRRWITDDVNRGLDILRKALIRPSFSTLRSYILSLDFKVRNFKIASEFRLCMRAFAALKRRRKLRALASEYAEVRLRSTYQTFLHQLMETRRKKVSERQAIFAYATNLMYKALRGLALEVASCKMYKKIQYETL
eukprot:TRINITY_DN17592_c0_g1_i2.p1 TRINITY_DN17592_c0_g1~~TRINITY_DN17592_c0_g1_i2.p1  ORF type:complete len:316 (-),score=51.62 TRINITY_DN17592_c0_g1_i2:85-1032(-)